MPELPKNPNVRQPYSDVSLELDYYVGKLTEVVGISFHGMSASDRQSVDIYLKCLDRAMLRARAVLDPTTLSGADWINALVTSYDLEGQLRG